MSSSTLAKPLPIRSSTSGVVGLLAFLAVFFLFGAGMLGFLFLPAAWHSYQARSWTRTPCTILSSSVESSRGSKSTTYKVIVRYQYTVSSKRYESDRYQFLSLNSSGYSSKAAVVARLRPGTRTLCYVNPLNPADAVLDPGLSGDMLFALIPAAFVAVSLLVGFITFRSTRPRSTLAGQTAWLPPSLPAAGAALHPRDLTLRPDRSPAAKFIGILAFAIIWNAAIGFFVWHILSGFSHGRGSIFEALFATPFVLVGLLVVVFTVYQFLALFAPRVQVTLGTTALSLGASTDLSWAFTGRADRIEHLQILLEGQEESRRPGRGRDSGVDIRTSTFVSIPIVDATSPMEIPRGRATLALPADTTHSLSLTSNFIRWALRVKGSIPHRPDVSQSFPLTVAPAALPQARSGASELLPAPSPNGSSGGVGAPLSLTLDSDSLAPGSALTGLASWSLSEPPASLTLRLLFHTSGFAAPDIRLVSLLPIPSPRATGQTRFRFSLPNGPYSCAGQFLQLTWSVELVAGKQAARADFVMSPTSEPIPLNTVPAVPLAAR